jgi:adenine-specific DNA-methyltransferase
MIEMISQLESKEYLGEQLITYIGNKRKLLDFIIEPVLILKGVLGKKKLSILDGFAGSGAVSRMFKQHCTVLHSNDLEPYARIIGECYLANRTDVASLEISEAIADLNSKRERHDLGVGFIEEMYAPNYDNAIADGERVFYTNQNAKIIDNMRRTIDDYPRNIRPFLLAPLLHKASVHANTSGVFKGFYKNSSTKRGQFGGNAVNCLSRITKEIELPEPVFSNFDCEYHMHQRDTNELVKDKDIAVDIAYFDPPYNQHPYGSNYFMLNIIESYERPCLDKISEVSGIPNNWNKSAYNKKEQARQSFIDLIRDTQASFILVSYSNDGILSEDELHAIFSTFGHVEVIRKSYTTFRASRNLGNRSKTVSELLFVIKKNT